MSVMQIRNEALTFTNPIYLETADKKSVTRILSYLTTRAQDFAVCHCEGIWTIAVDFDLRLDLLRDRLPGIKFEVTT